jgi:hypothetical protein
VNLADGWQTHASINIPIILSIMSALFYLSRMCHNKSHLIPLSSVPPIDHEFAIRYDRCQWDMTASHLVRKVGASLRVDSYIRLRSHVLQAKVSLRGTGRCLRAQIKSAPPLPAPPLHRDLPRTKQMHPFLSHQGVSPVPALREVGGGEGREGTHRVNIRCCAQDSG